MYSTKTKIQLLFAFVVLFIGLTALALMDTAAADETGTRSESISHTPTDISITAESTAEYISPLFDAEFTYNGIGLVWTGADTAAVEFFLQIDGSDWYPIAMMGDEAKDVAESFTSQPLFVTGKTIRYKITGQTEAVQNVRLVYFDSTVPPYRSVLSRLLSSSSGYVISREEWGADETYRFWEPEYSTPKKIVLHHTAGGDGGDDPAATIRGIYYWHAVVLGWGDIGYNYLIDPAGTVYEGRYGGDGTIGAHAYNSYTDTNYNVGSIGVALLGCYEDTDGACTTIDAVSADMQQATIDLITDKANQFGLNPAGTSQWFGTDFPNVVSHRDLDYTYCPGSGIYSLLETLRSTASGAYTSQRRYQAMYAGNDLANEYQLTDQPTVAISYTNVGRKPWHQADVVMQLRLNETGERQRVELETDVAPDATTTFANGFTVPTTPGEFTITSRLYRKGQPVNGSKHTHTITVTNPYQVKHISADYPVAIKAGWAPTLELVVRNTGTLTIPAGTVLELDGQTIATTQKDWPVGEKKSLKLSLTEATTWPPGINTLIFKMKVADITVQQSRLVLVMRVDQ